MDDVQIRGMGARGRKFVEENYEQHKIAKMMKDLYQWLLVGNKKPKFVYTL